MNEKEQQSALLPALTTEHFVMETASSATVNESAARASIYIMSVSTSVVAMAFASQSRGAFGPFAASVLPALFVLGIFTIIRLVDINGEYLLYAARIARIRDYYRALGGAEAIDYFGPVSRGSTPSLQLGPGIAFLTTTSSMVAFINNFVAGVGIALLSRWLLGIQHTFLAVLIGVGSGAALMALFLVYQKWRFSMFALVPMPEKGEWTMRNPGVGR